jgi:hypothetical protein
LYWERNKISCEVVANDGYFINLDSTRNRMHNPTIKITKLHLITPKKAVILVKNMNISVMRMFCRRDIFKLSGADTNNLGTDLDVLRMVYCGGQWCLEMFVMVQWMQIINMVFIMAIYIPRVSISRRGVV